MNFTLYCSYYMIMIVKSQAGMYLPARTFFFSPPWGRLSRPLPAHRPAQPVGFLFVFCGGLCYTGVQIHGGKGAAAVPHTANTRGVRGAADWCAVGALCYLAANTLLRAGISYLMGLRVASASLTTPVGYTQTAAGLLALLAGAGALALPVLFLLRATRLDAAALRVLWPGQWAPGFCLCVFLGLANVTNLVSGLLGRLFGAAGARTALPAGGMALAVDLMLLCVLPAVGEELLFRGALQGLMRPAGSAAAILAPALLFAFLHLDPAQELTALACGLFLGWLAERTGSILPGMLLHFANNCLAFLDLYLQQYAPPGLAMGVQACILLVFPLLGGLFLVRAGRQGFRFADGLRPGPRARDIFKSPVYTLTVVFLVGYTLYLQLGGAA